MQTSVIIRLLDTILLLIPRAVGLYTRVQVVRDEIEAMGMENPTDADWEATGRRTDEALDRLRAVRSAP